MGVSYEVDLRTLFKTFYCKNCGTKLVKKKLNRDATETEQENFMKELYPMGIPAKSQVKIVRSFFICPSCGNITTTDEQIEIRKMQKKSGTRILQ